ncbi:MAG TPA: hypothetical protein VFT64_11310 [Rickettsiales bacterium]|nr:hypothetical protein [Rickettsiales bacterium]
MSCCGQKRQNWQHYSQAPVPQPQPPEIKNPKLLYYIGETSLVIKGPATGRSYLFASGEEGLLVDENDITLLLEMKLFSLEKN